MKAVIIAGGRGSQTQSELAASLDRHIQTVGRKPLIHRPLETLAKMGVTDVLILVSGPNADQIQREVETGRRFGLNVLYAYHGARTTGAGDQLLAARPFVGRQKFIVMMGDSVYLQTPKMPRLRNLRSDFMWVMKSDDQWDVMQRYSQQPGRAAFVQAGVWIFTSRVFDSIKTLQPMRGMSLEVVVNQMQKGRKFECSELRERSFMQCNSQASIRKLQEVLNT